MYQTEILKKKDKARFLLKFLPEESRDNLRAAGIGEEGTFTGLFPVPFKTEIKGTVKDCEWEIGKAVKFPQLTNLRTNFHRDYCPGTQSSAMQLQSMYCPKEIRESFCRRYLR